MLMAKVVPSKGVSECAVEVARRFAEQVGYSKVIMKSDSELVILALKDAVKTETNVEIVMEESPVGDHQANGVTKMP